MELLQTHAQAFVVAAQAAEATEPGKAALHDPTPGQQHKAGLALRLFNHLQVKVVYSRRILRLFPCIALVNEAHRHGLPRNFLHLSTPLAYLRSFLLIGRGDDYAQ